MALSPTNLSKTYKKSVLIPSDNIIVTPADTSNGPFGDGPWVESKPNWLKVIYVSKQPYGGGNPDRVTYNVTINESVATGMAPGNYSGQIIFKHAGIVGKLKRQYFTYNLEIQETVTLKVSPNPLNFNSYTIGGNIPPTKFLSITTEGNWTANTGESWIVLGETSGSQNGQLEVNADVTGLPPGNHTGKIIITDSAGNSETVNVLLPVQGEVTPTEYLTVTPAAFEVSEKYQETPTKQRALKIDSSEAFTITDSVGWLLYSATSGSAGITNITVSTVSTETLPIGAYPATITITTNSSVKTVSVLLRITRAEVVGIASNGFYYADDRNLLTVTNDQDNSEIVVNFNTEASSGTIKPYTKKAPYVENIASVLMGLETVRLLRPNPFVSNINSRLFSPITPLKMDFIIYDKIIGQSALTQRSNFSNVQFINGKTPKIANRLTYIPTEITTVKDGVVSFSFKTDTVPTEITITGAIEATIPASGLAGNIFTAFVNLADYSLSVGDKITISCDIISIDVFIKKSEAERSQLIWLNEWQLPEIFDLTGVLQIVKPREAEETVINQEGKRYTKVLKTSQPLTYAVNTGNVYSQEEIDWLLTVLDAKQIFLKVRGETFEVVCTNKNLTLYETRNYNLNRTLTFKKAIQ